MEGKEVVYLENGILKKGMFPYKKCHCGKLLMIGISCIDPRTQKCDPKSPYVIEDTKPPGEI